MSDLSKFLIKAFVRKGLTALGAVLVTYGMLTDSADSFTSTYLDEAVGLVLLGISAAWTTAYQWYVKRKVSVALSLPSGSTPETLEKAIQK